MGLLDFLFPKYCVNCKKLGSYLCDNCFSYLSFNTKGMCLVCGGGSFDFYTHPNCRTRFTIDAAFSSIEYKGVAKKLVYQFKYKPFLSDLQTVLVDLLYEGVIQNEMLVKALGEGSKDICCSAIALHATRFRVRGYNQSEILARGLAKKLGLSYKNLLQRTKATKSQVGLTREKRKENISGAFSIRIQDEQIKNAIVFLVDDVLTTGSTLLEAARVLKRGGAKKVYGVTLARD